MGYSRQRGTVPPNEFFRAAACVVNPESHALDILAIFGIVALFNLGIWLLFVLLFKLLLLLNYSRISEVGESNFL